MLVMNAEGIQIGLRFLCGIVVLVWGIKAMFLLADGNKKKVVFALFGMGLQMYMIYQVVNFFSLDFSKGDPISRVFDFLGIQILIAFGWNANIFEKKVQPQAASIPAPVATAA